MVRQLVHTNNIGFNTHASGKTQLTFSLTTGEIPVSLTGKQYVRYEYNKSIGKKSMKVLISHRQARKLGGYLYGESTKGGALLPQGVPSKTLPSRILHSNPIYAPLINKVRDVLSKSTIPRIRNLPVPVAVNAVLDLKKAQDQQATGGGISKQHRSRIAKYEKIYGTGFWSDFWGGFKKGWTGTLDVLSKIPVLNTVAGPMNEATKAIHNATGWGLKGKRRGKGKKVDIAGGSIVI